MDSELYQYFFATEFVGENNFGSINFFRGFVKISFNEVCGVYEKRKTIIILHTLN